MNVMIMIATTKNVFATAALGALLLVGAGCSQPASAPAPSPAPEASAPQPSGDAAAGTVPEGSGTEAGGAADEGVDMEAKEGASGDGIKADAGVNVVVDAAASVKVFKIVAKSFEFAPSEIRVKMGDKVRLEVSSADTGAGSGHGIAIPAFNVNVKVDVGKSGVAEFIADKKGSYPFFCNVFCGSGHKEMKGTLIVE